MGRRVTTKNTNETMLNNTEPLLGFFKKEVYTDKDLVVLLGC